MTEDIKINSRKKLNERLFISNGSIMTEIIGHVKCLPLTYVPKEPWRRLNKNELAVLTNKNKIEYTDVSIIEIPNFLKKELVRLKLDCCINVNDINFIQSSKEYKLVLNKVINYFEAWANIKKSCTPHNLFFGQPNLKNNTFNTKENVYIGMHLDSWENEMIEKRINSRNRICINLGKEPRYLLFYNLSIYKMAEFLNEDITNFKTDINGLYKKFAYSFPNYPILKLKIMPYECYLAPTEFMIHDGCNDGSSYPDINLVIRGHYFYKKYNILTNFINNLNQKK